MINASIKVDFREVERMLATMKAQTPYVLQRSINDTMIDSQTMVVDNIQQRFIVRRAAFVKRSIKMIKFAKKNSLSATLGIAGMGGNDTSDILGKFETGKDKTAHSSVHVAVPTIVVRPNENKIVSKGKRPRNLPRAFRIHSKSGDDLILRRKGKGKRSKTEVAYVLKTSVPIDDRLHFVRDVVANINRRFPVNFNKWYRSAIETAL